MKFKFRLQSVLEYRAFLEDIKKMELARKQLAYNKEKEKGEKLRNLRLRYFEEIRLETAKENISIDNLHQMQAYINSLDFMIIKQDERTKKALEEVYVAQQALVEAKRQKEILDKFKKKSYEKYVYEEGMKEQKVLDDMSSIRYVRSVNTSETSCNAARM